MKYSSLGDGDGTEQIGEHERDGEHTEHKIVEVKNVKSREEEE
jgi:hypothetical protein